MTPLINRALIMGVLSLALVSAHALYAAPPSEMEHYYYDGGNKKLITPEPKLIAEFAGQARQNIERNASPHASASARSSGGPVTLHKIQHYSPRSAANASQTGNSANVSPVFREGNSPVGRLMALPGGVIINFKPEWTDAQISDWVFAKGYTIQQRLNITGNWYIIQTPPGQPSLDISNAIHESGEVISASPNWWKQTVTK